MDRLARFVCAVVVGLAAGCSLNPQPEPPGGNEGSDAAGSTAPEGKGSDGSSFGTADSAETSEEAGMALDEDAAAPTLMDSGKDGGGSNADTGAADASPDAASDGGAGGDAAGDASIVDAGDASDSGDAPSDSVAILAD